MKRVFGCGEQKLFAKQALNFLWPHWIRQGKSCKTFIKDPLFFELIYLYLKKETAETIKNKKWKKNKKKTETESRGRGERDNESLASVISLRDFHSFCLLLYKSIPCYHYTHSTSPAVPILRFLSCIPLSVLPLSLVRVRFLCFLLFSILAFSVWLLRNSWNYACRCSKFSVSVFGFWGRSTTYS